MKSFTSSKKNATPVATQVKSYVASLPPDRRKALKELREAILAAAPDATQHFSYGVPGFKLDGKPLVWYAVWTSHMSIYPMTDAIRRAHAAQLEEYEMPKGTIRFPLAKPMPSALVKKLVKARVAEVRKK